MEEAGEELKDMGDAAAEAWDQTVDFFTSLW
jgi:hypothetical protein